MKITFYGHACFAVTSNGYTVVLDPYKDVKGYDDINLDANMVICSHLHYDHSYVDGVKIKEGCNQFKVSSINCFHDDCGGAKRGNNVITVLEAEGKRIAHLGDLGHMLGDQDISLLQNLDALMIPVGGNYTIDAKTAVEIINALNPKLILPMHYRSGKYGFDEIDDIELFLSLADDNIKSKLALVRGYGQSIEI